MDERCRITVDDSALARIRELRATGSSAFGPEALLRVAVEGGGCSGYQYRIEAADKAEDGDIVLENAVLVDEVSAQYMKNSVIRYQNDMMGAMFVVDNPNAQSSCGCRASFSIDADAL